MSLLYKQIQNSYKFIVFYLNYIMTYFSFSFQSLELSMLGELKHSELVELRLRNSVLSHPNSFLSSLVATSRFNFLGTQITGRSFVSASYQTTFSPIRVGHNLLRSFFMNSECWDFIW